MSLCKKGTLLVFASCFIYFRVQTIFILAVVSVLCCGAFFTLRGTGRFLWRCLAPPVHSWLHHELMWDGKLLGDCHSPKAWFKKSLIIFGLFQHVEIRLKNLSLKCNCLISFYWKMEAKDDLEYSRQQFRESMVICWHSLTFVLTPPCSVIVCGLQDCRKIP